MDIAAITLDGVSPHDHRNYDTVEEPWDQSTCEALLSRVDDASVAEFLARLKGVAGGRDSSAWIFDSGREALGAVLATAITPERRTVLMSAFNCPAVAEAALAAGAEVETMDVDSPNGAIDWASWQRRLHKGHAAIVVPHLFGAPTDFREIIPAARAANVLVIEDCAQTLSAKLGGQAVGSLGDAAIFSFGYDKPVSLGGGGALVVHDADRAARVTATSIPRSRDDEWGDLQRFCDFLAARRDNIRPPAFARVRNRMRRALRTRTRDDRSQIHGIGPLRSSLGLQQLDNLPEVATIRNRNADRIADGGHGAYVPWHVEPASSPMWLKQKVLMPSRTSAAQAAQRLQRMGYRVGRFNWPRTIDDLAGSPAGKNASALAERGLDIPIHQNLRDRDLDTMIEVLRAAATGRKLRRH